MLDRFSEVIKQNSELSALLSKFSQRSLRPYLVGGAVRDFAIYQTLGDDFDIELHGIEPDRFQVEVKRLLNECDFIESIEFLKFAIVRAYSQSSSYEFTPPRLESYDRTQKVFGHSDFSVSLYRAKDTSESFIRRDFTINAISVSFKGGELVLNDPFNGILDIKNKVLRECSDDFLHDPVRFLRYIRFKDRFGFTPSESLEGLLKYFNLTKLTRHHFFAEAVKSRNIGLFVSSFYQLVDDLKVELPGSLSQFRGWASFSNYRFQSLEELFYASVRDELVGEEELFAQLDGTGIKKKSLTNLLTYYGEDSGQKEKRNIRSLGRFEPFVKLS